MPPRRARSSVSVAAPKLSKNKSRKRQLDAFAIAGKTAPEKSKVKSHRLGEVLDDKPRNKRRRTEDDEDDSGSDDEEEGESSRSQRKKSKSAMPGDDEEVEYGSDSEGNEWVTGGLADDDDDESLDSDAAFGESDEERFEGFTFRGSGSSKGKKGTKPKTRPSRNEQSNQDEMDLQEDNEDLEEEDEDDFGDEGVDLATMLDADEDDDLKPRRKKVSRDTEDEELSGEEDDDDNSEDENDDSDTEATSDNESNVDDEERHARLQDLLEGLDGQDSRKGAAILSENNNQAMDLTIDDFLEDAALDAKTMATLKPKRKSKAPQVVTAPLPKRQQDRIDRDIATTKAKEQLDRWRDTVIHNRRAEFLSFPLRDPDQAEPVGKDSFTPAQQSQPRTDLEASIRKIMEESGMTSKSDAKGSIDDFDQDLIKAEELATNQMPVEEVLRRRAELRRARDLLFRDEVKSRRVAKIKSKAYRRVHRKERERLAEKERMLLDPEGHANGEMNEDEKELADRRRAEARMGAKHKDSKWARSLRATDRTVWDESAREGVIEQARRQEELKRRVAGNDTLSDDDDSDDDLNVDNDDDDATFRRQLNSLSEPDVSQEEKGLAGMKFMRNAEARRKAENDEAVAQLRREFDDAPEESSDEEEGGLGRAIFGPKPKERRQPLTKARKPELEEAHLSGDEVDNADELDDPPLASHVRQKQPKSILKNSSKADRPFAKTVVPDRRSPPREESPKPSHELSAWLTAPSKKSSKLDKKLARNNDDFFIDTRIGEPEEQTSPADKGSAKEKPAAGSARANDTGNTDGWTTVPYKDPSANDSPSDEADAEPTLTPARRNAAFQTRAFAGDDVALHFSDEKAALAASEDEQESSTHMPGWGSWTGSGLTKAARKAATRARHNPLYKNKVPGTKPQDRKDAKLENVIISEKGDRRGKKYLAPMLPHQFERKEEYERSLRMPLGPEWATKEVFQRNTRPRVVVKPGSIVAPIEKPIV